MSESADMLAGAPSFQFNNIGDAVGGTIIGCKVEDSTDMKGQPIRVLILLIETKDGDEFSVWCQKGSQRLSALSMAVRGADRDDIVIGDKVSFTFSDTKPGKTQGTAKIYTVQYKATAPSAVGADDLI